MRVAIFIDAKYFYNGWRDDTGRRDLDFERLAKWIVKSVGGTRLLAAHYYAGLDEGSVENNPIAAKVAAFLDGVDEVPGYHVHRFAQTVRTHTCANCGHVGHRPKPIALDTTMVADMIRLAAQDAFDVAVLVAMDSTFAPAVEAVRALGKQVWAATWGGADAVWRLRDAVFDCLQIRLGLDEFARAPGQGSSPLAALSGGVILPQPPAAPAVLSNDPKVYEEACVTEIRRAQAAMPGGYVGANFFVTRWKSSTLPDIPEFRRRMLDRVVEQGKAEIVLTDDGVQAVRLKG